MRRLCCYCPKWSDAPFHLLNHKTAEKIHLDTRIIGIKMTKQSVTSEVMSQMVSVCLSSWVYFYPSELFISELLFSVCQWFYRVFTLKADYWIQTGLEQQLNLTVVIGLCERSLSLLDFRMNYSRPSEHRALMRQQQTENMCESWPAFSCVLVLVESSRTLWLFFRVWPLNVTAAYIKPAEGVSNDFTPHRCRRTLFIVNLQPN